MVGIVLLTAIAIVLAAVAANAVFGLNLFGQDVGPTISFSTEYDGDAETVNLTHESGSDVEWEHVEVIASGGNGTVSVDAHPTVLSSGETVDLSDVQRGETIRIIWKSPETDKSYVIYKKTF